MIKGKKKGDSASDTFEMAETREKVPVKRQRTVSSVITSAECELPDGPLLRLCRALEKRVASLEFEMEQVGDKLTAIDEHLDELRIELENASDDVRNDLDSICDEITELKRRFDRN